MGLKRDCDFCGEPAIVDGPTLGGPWAYMCSRCLSRFGRPNSALNTILANVP